MNFLKNNLVLIVLGGVFLLTIFLIQEVNHFISLDTDQPVQATSSVLPPPQAQTTAVNQPQVDHQYSVAESVKKKAVKRVDASQLPPNEIIYDEPLKDDILLQ